MTFVAGSDSALLRDMIDHHSLQGVDAFLIADSGASADVSRTLGHYCGRGDVFLHGIAGSTTDEGDAAELLAHGAFAHHGATCVLSAGAGDFWLARDRGQTLRQVLEVEQPSSRDSLVPLAGTDSGVPATRFERRIRWDPTASTVSEDRPAVATRIEAYRRPIAAESATEARRILQKLNDARFQRSVDLANEAENLRAELQRMRARKIVRVADRVHGSLVNARIRQRTLAARVSTLPAGTLSWWRSKRARVVSLRSNVIRRREVTRLLTLELSGGIENGSPGTTALPVVMCLWNRPQRIDTMLESLARQATNHHLRVILWNNAPQDAGYYREHVRAFHRHGALDSIELLSNPVNIGGMARFVVARALWEQGLRGPFIMVDDDQDLDETFVEDSLAGYEAHTINAWWAFRNHGSHWSRSALEPGETADYGGTGGAAVDLAIVEDRAFFDIPVRYFMLEDQWMSHYAHAHGWTIRKSSAQITAVLEETNQYHALRELKDEFFTFLHS
jgi:hypothetical protein